MAQLAERSLPIPEDRGSNPVICKILSWTNSLLTVEKTKINKKRPGMAQFLRWTNTQQTLKKTIKRTKLVRRSDAAAGGQRRVTKEKRQIGKVYKAAHITSNFWHQSNDDDDDDDDGGGPAAAPKLFAQRFYYFARKSKNGWNKCLRQNCFNKICWNSKITLSTTRVGGGYK